MDGRLLDDAPVLVETALFARTIGCILHVLEASHLPLELSFQYKATSQQFPSDHVISFLFLEGPPEIALPVEQTSVQGPGSAAGQYIVVIS